MTSTQPEYQTQQKYQLIVLQPQGYLDLQHGKSLKEQLIGLAPQPHQLWVIDLAEVNFIDSSGLVALVAAQKAARSSGCRLVICNLQAPVRIVFELTRLDSVFEIFDTYDAVLTTVNPCF
ncbi:anti-anti-sigma factor [Calothrix sp. HK-06]|nr:anti-anti-sigma factor [Calothrix sp. HK-06]